MPKKFIIFFFEKSKRKPAEEFLRSLSKSTIAKSLRILDLLEIYGPLIGMPYVKKIAADLFELRVRGREETRFLFTCRKNVIVIVHGFKKKKGKIPRKEIKTAQKRLTEI